MRTVRNVTEFGEILIFAEHTMGIFYNAAHQILAREFWPDRDGIELYRSEVDQYTNNQTAVEILTKYMDHHKVKYINIVQ